MLFDSMLSVKTNAAGVVRGVANLQTDMTTHVQKLVQYGKKLS